MSKFKNIDMKLHRKIRFNISHQLIHFSAHINIMGITALGVVTRIMYHHFSFI